MSAEPVQPSLLQDLRSKKLAQWLVAYGAGAWVLLQVLSLLIGAYHWPDSWADVKGRAATEAASRQWKDGAECPQGQGLNR